MDIVGVSVPRPDAAEKVTGRAVYLREIEVPGMAYGKILPSPFPHALITHIDASRARKMPGVYGVLTSFELKDMELTYGSGVPDRPVVAIDKVRFQGEPVAAVAAVDEATAQEALELIQVEYEDLPIVTDVMEALSPDSSKVHDSNLLNEVHYHWGDVEKGFAESDRIFEDTFTFPMVYHYAMEPHAAIARYDSQGITVWSSAQHPFSVRTELARVFRLPLHRVNVIVPYLGGGFGSKSNTKVEPLAVALSKEAGRPVRVALSVDEAFKTVRRHAALMTVKTGVKLDGTFVARDCLVHMDTGAYADNGPGVTGRVAYRIPGPYRWPNLNVSSYGVYTNTTPAGSYRSIGAPQAAWASESQVDIIAAGLGIDPLEIRLKNVAARGEMVREGLRLLDADMAQGLRAVTKAIGWGEKAAKKGDGTNGEGTQGGVKRGLGLACSLANAGGVPTSTAILRMHLDETATVMVGTTENGQGARAVLSQIVAQELEIPLERVGVVTSDTSIVPFDRSTGSSRSTTSMGLAVQGAAREVKDQLMQLAAQHFEAPEEQLVLKDGAIYYSGERVAFRQLIKEKFGDQAGELLGRGYVTLHDQGGTLGHLPVFWEVGIAAAEVEVDESTGVVKILRYYSVADAGKAINPKQCEGQDEGAAMQGMGHTLFEEMLYEDGQLMNSNLIDYRVPTFADLPEEFHTILIENGDGPGPYGAKGIGEGGIVPVAPAVSNAIYNATGVRIKDLPLTPERVWRALEEHKSKS